MPNDSEVKNLKAIADAIDQHNRNCKRGPVAEVRMNPFEVERLDWTEIKGVPIVPDADVPTGRGRLICAGEGNGVKKAEAAVAVTEDREVVVEKEGDLLKIA